MQQQCPQHQRSRSTCTPMQPALAEVGSQKTCCPRAGGVATCGGEAIAACPALLLTQLWVMRAAAGSL